MSKTFIKAIIPSVVVLCFSANVWSQNAKRDALAIERVKTTLASSLDTALPRISLKRFLENAGQGVPIQWEVNDCGEQTGEPATDAGRDFPLCVEADIKLQDRRGVTLLVSVGTFKRGLQGRPALFSLIVIDEGGEARSLRRLGELPAELQRPKKSPAEDGHRGFEATSR